VGTPEQQIHVLPDPFRSAVIVVGPQGCLPNSGVDDCKESRGNVFDPGQSSSFHGVDGQTWNPTETILRPPNRGGKNSSREQPLLQQPLSSNNPSKFGIETVSGKSMGSRWTIPDQGVMVVSTMYPFIGRLGLSTHVMGLAKNPVSLFDHVRGISGVRGMKSVSWSYTAGNKASKL
jgi:hypothetical protein